MKMFGQTVLAATVAAMDKHMRGGPFSVDSLVTVIAADKQFTGPAARRMAERVITDAKRAGKIDYAQYGIGAMWKWKGSK